MAKPAARVVAEWGRGKPLCRFGQDPISKSIQPSYKEKVRSLLSASVKRRRKVTGFAERR